MHRKYTQDLEDLDLRSRGKEGEKYVAQILQLTIRILYSSTAGTVTPRNKKQKEKKQN